MDVCKKNYSSSCSSDGFLNPSISIETCVPIGGELRKKSSTMCSASIYSQSNISSNDLHDTSDS